MIPLLCRNWWAVAIRGTMAVLFALGTFLWPRLTLAVLVLWFGAYLTIDGIFAMLSALRAAKEKARWWPFLLEGLVGISLGVATFIWPAITALALLWVVAGWALLSGVFRVAAAIRLRREIRGEWLLALSGLASIGFGLGVAVFPQAAGLAIAWIIAGYAAVLGVILIVLAFRLRGWKRAFSAAG